MLRSYDAHAKPIDGLRKHTTVGGIITLMAYLSALILFISQLALYAKVDIKEHFRMAENVASPFLLPQRPISPNERAIQAIIERKFKIPLSFHLTFNHVDCRDLEVVHDNARGALFEKLHGENSYTKRPPTKQEATAAGMNGKQMRGGCTVKGKLLVSKVGGMFGITMTNDTWRRLMFQIGDIQFPNVSHHIHSLEFGDPFPHSENPLNDSRNLVKIGTDVAINNIMVKLISTKYKRFARSTLDMHQISVSQNMVYPNPVLLNPGGLLPGIYVHYDFTPLAVHHIESRENIFVFLSSLISIVGGAFVTLGLASSFLINAATIGKKMD